MDGSRRGLVKRAEEWKGSSVREQAQVRSAGLAFQALGFFQAFSYEQRERKAAGPRAGPALRAGD